MSILKREVVVQKTEEQLKLEKLSKVKEDIEMMVKNSYGFLISVQNRGIDILWNNRNFTPQEILDVVGDNSGKLFAFHGLLTEFLIQLSALDNVVPDVKPPTNNFTLNPDGTVTVLNEPYSV